MTQKTEWPEPTLADRRRTATRRQPDTETLLAELGAFYPVVAYPTAQDEPEEPRSSSIRRSSPGSSGRRGRAGLQGLGQEVGRHVDHVRPVEPGPVPGVGQVLDARLARPAPGRSSRRSAAGGRGPRRPRPRARDREARSKLAAELSELVRVGVAVELEDRALRAAVQVASGSRRRPRAATRGVASPGAGSEACRSG